MYAIFLERRPYDPALLKKLEYFVLGIPVYMQTQEGGLDSNKRETKALKPNLATSAPSKASLLNHKEKAT
jgi:hypothetical protein